MKLSVETTRDPQSVTPEWDMVSTGHIEGVVAHEAKPVLTNTGTLVELLRSDWLVADSKVDHVFTRTLDPGAVSAWHVHHTAIDRLSCVGGRALVVLYDARLGSPTHGALAEYRIGPARPTLLIVPPGVVHGVKALGSEIATLVNMVSEAYAYSEPDHWRVSQQSAQVPYRFTP
jgi:dTDP-4-dehydrorhamnose 3,5-epimerase